MLSLATPLARPTVMILSRLDRLHNWSFILRTMAGVADKAVESLRGEVLEMKVTVRLAGHLGGYAGSRREVTMELPEGARAGDLVALLGIPQGEVGSLYLDGAGARVDAPLQEGSRVELFPPVAGGCAGHVHP